MNMSITRHKETHAVQHSRVRKALIVAATIGGALLANGAWAGDSSAAPLTKVVSYADLDLDRQAGVEVLYRRIRLAAYRVCEPFEGRRLSQTVARRNCVEQAIEQAITEVDRPILSAYHLARTGTAAAPAVLAQQ